MRAIVILLSCAMVVMAAQKSYEGCKVFSVAVDSVEKLIILREWEQNGVDFWDSVNLVNKPTRVMVPPLLLRSFEQFLEINHITYQLIIADVEAVLIQERKSMALNRAQGASSADFSRYWRYSEINLYLTELASQYPNVTTLINVGSSYEGRDILGLKISLNGFQAGVPIIFVDATIHAREWITPMAALNLIHQLVEHTDDNLDMLINSNWIILPVANPDGYEYSHTNERFWRKTRNVNEGSSCNGVDANRNFAYQWEAFTGISTDPCSYVFNGPSAASEPEVQAVSNAMAASSVDIKLYVSLHSYGNYILYPYGYAAVHHPNREEIETLGAMVASAIFENRGVSYTIGNAAIVMYLSSGTSDDYAAGGQNISLSYAFELSGGGSQGFDLPEEKIQEEVDEIFIGFQVMARYIANQ